MSSTLQTMGNIVSTSIRSFRCHHRSLFDLYRGVASDLSNDGLVSEPLCPLCFPAARRCSLSDAMYLTGSDSLSLIVAVTQKELSSVSTERTTFHNLRIMRQYKTEMFSNLVPMAKLNHPDANGFETDFVMNAIRIHDPEAFKRNKKEKEKASTATTTSNCSKATANGHSTSTSTGSGTETKSETNSKTNTTTKTKTTAATKTTANGDGDGKVKAESTSKSSRSRSKLPKDPVSTTSSSPSKNQASKRSGAVTSTPSSGRSTTTVHISHSGRSPNKSSGSGRSSTNNREAMSNGVKKEGRHYGGSGGGGRSSTSSSSTSTSSSGLDVLDPLDSVDVAVTVVS